MTVGRTAAWAHRIPRCFPAAQSRVKPRQIVMETPEQRIQRVVREDIAISPCSPCWPESFRQEKEHLRSCLPADLVGPIEHFGSTAVPGLAAKPIVDMWDRLLFRDYLIDHPHIARE